METLEATTKLIDTTDQVASRRSKITSSLAFDLALTCYTEQHRDFDGVWWMDRLRPQESSAPYGTLLRTDRWDAVPHEFSDFAGWDELEDFGT